MSSVHVSVLGAMTLTSSTHNTPFTYVNGSSEDV